ncbi:MAG: phospholipase D family protein, partial [Candidatus Aenigmarchaeota archaeon]|nr:phospholipase D family protein [Candidatus Aenigmarchaeota archaeon]
VPWPVRADQQTINTLEFLKNEVNQKDLNFEIFPVKELLHAKVYLFEGESCVFISSLNLTKNSWTNMLETAVVSDDKMQIDEIRNGLGALTKTAFHEILVDERENPLGPDDGGGVSAERVSVPFELEGKKYRGLITKALYSLRRRIKIKRSSVRARIVGEVKVTPLYEVPDSSSGQRASELWSKRKTIDHSQPERLKRSHGYNASSNFCRICEKRLRKGEEGDRCSACTSIKY